MVITHVLFEDNKIIWNIIAGKFNRFFKPPGMFVTIFFNKPGSS
jgi:hypothetical protein